MRQQNQGKGCPAVALVALRIATEVRQYQTTTPGSAFGRFGRTRAPSLHRASAGGLARQHGEPVLRELAECAFNVSLTRVPPQTVADLGAAQPRGRLLLDTLRRFGDVKDWEARSRLLESFAGAVEAAYVMAWRAGAGPDTRRMPEVELLGCESVDERRTREHGELQENFRRVMVWLGATEPPK